MLYMLTFHRSHESAMHKDLLSGYQVHLTPSLKPEREHMSDIIRCSGGEPVDFASPISAGENVLVVSCEEDLELCKEAMETGVKVHSAELILGGVLRQELDLSAYPQNYIYTAGHAHLFVHIREAVLLQGLLVEFFSILEHSGTPL